MNSSRQLNEEITISIPNEKKENNKAKGLPYTITKYKHQLKQIEKLINNYPILNKEKSTVIKNAQDQLKQLRTLAINTTLETEQHWFLNGLIIIHSLLSLATAAASNGFHWSGLDLSFVIKTCSQDTYHPDNLISVCQNAVDSYLGSGFISFYSIGAGVGATIKLIESYAPKKLKEKYFDWSTPTFSVK